MNVPGDVVDGRFELLERLGSGGMGTVWRARDAVLHREVALKAVRVLHDPATSDVVRERVMREARALARLSHPQVVTVHQIIDDDPQPWIVMELVPGVSLDKRLEAGPLTPVEAARIGGQVLDALRAAHAAGVQHRDVKPANILLREDGSAVLTDFGIAALQGATALTMTGELIGSPEYIAPERIRGPSDDPAADLWSLGIVLYVCVEGVSPLRRETSLTTLAAVLESEVPPPSRSGALAPVLEALLDRDPAARPEAGRLAEMLARVAAGGTAGSVQRTLTEPLPVAAGRGPESGETASYTASVATAADRREDGRRPGRSPSRRKRIAVSAVLAVAVAVAAVLLAPRLLDGDGSNGDSDRASGTSTSPPPSATPPAVTERWIAQLHSEPVDSGTAARDAQLAKVRESVPEAVFVRSDAYASLRPGYWVIYAPGPFADGRAALSFCGERGLTTPDTCVGRYLSTSATDFADLCRPPADKPTGRCTRG
ncbi:serine/threonine-protein kinase [Streptomyces turgidiscabies]|uniref:non-specific serine/threonine protein kinase n=1 Tax=Streptomyces turgidiscabies (strain Car8) TaxID=698760 RepID=L7F1B4_STRT8|nr:MULTISPECIES: serine/threonine-protein kinase [Streptomyces]ELP64939.1 kinase domain protein [Streptomyces turgidiscabies Car8]MDX3495135.1 serine/threonine-protein kinase [Streptomyces turgidiscabies]GAQ71008.1 serine/threonine-protein kinase StkP [Streptomyces turgidiscabies]